MKILFIFKLNELKVSRKIINETFDAMSDFSSLINIGVSITGQDGKNKLVEKEQEFTRLLFRS